MEIRKKGKWLEIVVPKGWTERTIEDVLKNQLQIPKTMLHSLRMDKTVKLNHQITPWQSLLKSGDFIQLELFVEEEFGVTPEYKEISILYEDDHVLIVNKQAGIDTHPTKEGQLGTLANAVAFHYQTQGLQTKVRHVHRLDRDTTGAILFAKDRLSSSILDRMLERRDIKRTYLALVHGLMKQKKGKIDEPIGRDRHHPTRRRVSPTGQVATTHFNVLKTFPSKKLSLVELNLSTGRTHQIRVHMSHIGYPLVGDELYGGQAITKRQALHAHSLQLFHPITNDLIEVQAPLIDISEPYFEFMNLKKVPN
ncbi:RluA family pseudouridine synthase [Litchfieldia alkalitelluris]|uniref:RluA family pseudouridine synthase n=1 Tax=Litchfieldia alkalitelluris TaxID=304268 RepID=UPI001F470D9B|nr:RluA family pseudouridine synthase [Litchfieldia alkalitelluris]